jgi:leader peptidase (prepilin peptidase) / N-methyltransferase
MIRRAGRGRAVAVTVAVLAVIMVPPLMDASLIRILAGIALCVLAAIIAIEDLTTMLVPDAHVAAIGAIGLGLAAHHFAEPAGIAWWVLAATMVAGALLAFSLVYGRIRGMTVLGLGDVKLVAASGLLVGPWGVALQIMLASVSAILFVLIRNFRRGRRPRRTARVPFATFLAPAAVIVWAWVPAYW